MGYKSEEPNITSYCDTLVEANQFESENSVFLRSVAFTILITGVVTIFLGFVYFLIHRKKYSRTAKRNVFLLANFALGSIIFVASNSIRAFVGIKNFPCRLESMLPVLGAVFLAQSSLFRLFSLIWRVNFNKHLINLGYEALFSGQLVIKPGKCTTVQKDKTPTESYYLEALEDVSPSVITVSPSYRKKDSNVSSIREVGCFMKTAIRLKISKYLASQKLASTLHMILAIILLGIGCFLTFVVLPLNEEKCFGCNGPVGNKLRFVLYIIAGIYGIGAIYCIIKLSYISDSLGIKRELTVLATTYLIFNLFLGFLLRGLFNEVEEEGKFDWSMIPCVQLILLSIYLFPYQIHLAHLDHTCKTIDLPDFDYVLSNDKGIKALALYMACGLSLESLLFYKEAHNWKESFPNTTSSVTNTQAYYLYRKYIVNQAPLMINVSHLVRTSIGAAVEESYVHVGVFDDAIAETYLLMKSDVFPRFLKSYYYRAFNNEMTNIDDNL